MNRVRTEVMTAMSRLVLLLALVGAFTPGCDSEPSPEETALAVAIERGTAFEAAAGSLPAEASGFTVPEGVELRVFCGTLAECPDANTMMVFDDSLSRYRALLQHAEAGDDDFDLSWFRDHQMPAMDQLRFLATKVPDEASGDAAWHGRVAVWDSVSGTWLGAVRVDLERGRVPQHAYAYFDQRGNQVGGSFHDVERDTQRANRDFQNVLPKAFVAAVESGRDVTRIDQVTRVRPRPLGATIASDAVIISGGNRGQLSAFSEGAFVDLGTDEVTDLWEIESGFVYRRAENVLEEGEPSMLRVTDGRVEDLTYFSDLPFMEPKAAGGGIWLEVHGTEGPGHVATWVDGDWELTEIDEAMAPTARRVVALDEREETLALLTSGSNGPGVRFRRGGEWSAVALPRCSVSDVLLESASSALVATNEGLYRVTLDGGEAERLSRQSVKRLFGTSQGAWFATQRTVLSHVDLFRVEGSSVVPVREMRSHRLMDLAVAPDGTVAILDRGVVRRRSPDGAVVQIPAEGTIPGTVATIDIDVDSHGNVWIASTAGLFVGNEDGLHTLAATAIPAAAAPIREVRVLGAGPSLTAADLRPVP